MLQSIDCIAIIKRLARRTLLSLCCCHLHFFAFIILLMKICRSFLFFCLLFFQSVLLQAQFVVQYPSTAEQITVCSGSSLLSVRVDASAISTGNTVTISLGTGVNYVSGSITRTGGTAGVDITGVDDTDLGNPVISISDMAIGDFLVFTIERSADCSAYDHLLASGVFKDIVTVAGSGGSITENDPNVNAYSVVAPTFSLTQPSAVNNAVVGGTYTRSWSITNGAVANADEVFFYIVYPAGGLSQNALALSGFGAISPTSTNGDTLFYTLSGTQLGADNLLTNGEVLSFTEDITVNACDANTLYRAGWGCDAPPRAWCQTTSGSGSLSMATGVPNLSLSFARVTAGNFCDGDLWQYTITNNGSEAIGGAGTAFNIQAVLGTSRWSTPQSPENIFSSVSLSDFAINGVPLTAIQSGTGPHVVDFSQINAAIAGAGLVDADGDGQFDDLPVGATVVLQYRLEWDCTVFPSSCRSPGFDVTPNARLNYEQQCGSSFFNWNTNPLGTLRYVLSGTQTLDATGPTDIFNSNPFRPRFCFGTPGENIMPLNTNGQLEFVITLPPGIAISGGGNAQVSINGGAFSNITFSQIGNQITFLRPYLNSRNTICFEIDLEGDCATSSGLQSIDFEANYINDALACPGCTYDLACNTYQISLNCPCAITTGVNNSAIESERTTLGWTDASLSTRIDPSILSPLELKRLLPLDTALVVQSGVQLSGTTYDNLHYTFESGLNAGGFPYLGYVSGVLEVNKNSGGPTYSCPLPSPTIMNAGTISTWDFDLNALIGTCLPLGMAFEPGDTYEISMNIIYTGNGLPGGEAGQVPDTEGYFYNLNASSVRQFCNNPGTELYIFPISAGNGFFGQTTLSPGCNRGIIRGITRETYRSVEDIYPNEFRPGFYMDSIQFVLPPGFELDPTGTPLYRIHTGNLAVSEQAFPTAPIQNGNILTFVNDGSWILGDIAPNILSASFDFTIPIIASCESVEGSNLITGRSYLKNRYYARNPSPTPSLPPATVPQVAYSLGNTPRVYNGKPNISLLDQSGVVQATSPVESWLVRLSSNSTTTAPFTWIAIPTQASASVVNVVDIATNTPLTPISYAGGVWYQLSAVGLASGATADYRIDFTYTSCSLDRLQIIAGWNCGAFPSSPDEYPCETEELFLFFNPEATEVELANASLPMPPVSLCEDLEYEYFLNSSQAASLVDPSFRIEALMGMNVVSLEAEYPRGAGNWEAISPTVSGNVYDYDLSLHSAYDPNQGIVGTIDAASNEERQMSVRFRINNSCDFISGNRFRVSAFANRPCGEPAINNGVALLSPPIVVDGVVNPYLTSSTITIANNLEGCDGSTNLMIETVILAGDTDTDGLIYIDVPSGLELDPTTLSCSNPIAECPTYNSQQIFPTYTRYVFNMADNVPSGTSISYAVDVLGTNEAVCGLYTVNLQTVVRQTGVSCATEASGLCSEVFVNTGNASGDLTFVAPEAVFNNSTICALASGDYKILADIEITTLDLTAAEDLILQVYCPTNLGVSIGSYTINGPLAIGEVAMVDFDIPAVCGNVTDLVLRLSRPENCICESVETTSPVTIQPAVEGGVSQTICSNGIVNLNALGASITPMGNTGIWTSSGSGVFDDGAGVFGVATTYTPSEADITLGSISLTLTPDPDGACDGQEGTMTITILPVNCGVFPWNGNE